MNKTQQLFNVPELLATRKAWEQRLRNPDTSCYLQGMVASGRTSMYENPEQRVQEALDDLAKQAELLNDNHVFRPLCVDSSLHGVHFVDKIFGAEVYELDGEKGNWQVKHLPAIAGSLKPPDLETNPTWAAARAFAQSFIARSVTLPVLMLPTIASALNVGLNLYGQELLVTMMTDP